MWCGGIMSHLIWNEHPLLLDLLHDGNCLARQLSLKWPSLLLSVVNSLLFVWLYIYGSRCPQREGWLQTTQPTSGGAVTADSSCCANCVESHRPQQWGPDLPFFGHAGHADPLDGWHCCSRKRVMSRPIQVRQV